MARCREYIALIQATRRELKGEFMQLQCEPKKTHHCHIFQKNPADSDKIW